MLLLPSQQVLSEIRQETSDGQRRQEDQMGMHMTTKLVLAALGGLAMACSSAIAADYAAPKVMPVEAKAPDPLIGFSFGSRYQTDYSFRGVSQSNLQGS